MPIDWREKKRASSTTTVTTTHSKTFSVSPSSSKKPSVKKHFLKNPAKKRPNPSSNKLPPTKRVHQAHTAILSRDQRHEQLIQCNKVWNELRQDDTDQARRLEICNELHSRLKSKLVDYSQRPDTSRVIQSTFKFGAPEIRQSVLDELNGNFVNLCKGKHSSFLMVALLKHGSQKDRLRIIQELRPHARALGTHGSGARVINFILSSSSKEEEGKKIFSSEKERSRFVEMFYGNELLLLGGSGTSEEEHGLKSYLTKANNKPGLLQSMKQALMKMADKGLLRFPYAQRLMNEYLSCASASDVREMIPCVREASLAMVGTWEGAQAVSAVFVASDAKDRKKMLKEWKGHVVDLCAHQFAWLVIAKALMVMDDTVTLFKSILEELCENQENLLALIMQKDGHARKVILCLLVGTNDEHARTYFSEEDKIVLFRQEEHSTSLKPNLQRQEEIILKFLPSLLACMETNNFSVLTGEGSRTFPSDVLRECLGCKQGFRFVEERGRLCELLAEKGSELMEDPRIHLLLKRVLKDEVDYVDIPRLSFGKALMQQLKGKIMKLTKVNRACFVLEALLKHPHGSKELLKELKASELEADLPGCLALRKAMTELNGN